MAQLLKNARNSLGHGRQSNQASGDGQPRNSGGQGVAR